MSDNSILRASVVAGLLLVVMASACGEDSAQPGADGADTRDVADTQPDTDVATDTPPDTDVAADTSEPNTQGWTVDGPWLRGPNLFGVSASGPDDVWAVGYGGTVMRYDGDVWTTLPPPLGDERALYWSVWATAPDDVWLIAVHRPPLHWNGVGWQAHDLGDGASLNDIWGCGDGAVTAVGNDGLIATWDGTSWTTRDVGDGLNHVAISGLDCSTAYVASARVGHYSSTEIFKIADGQAQGVHADGCARIGGIWAGASDDVVAVGTRCGDRQDRTIAITFDGMSWRTDELSVTAGAVYGVHGIGAAEVWAFRPFGTPIRRTDGEWVEVTAPNLFGGLNAAARASDTVTWLVGQDRGIYELVDDNITNHAGPGPDLVGGCALGDAIWVVGRGGVLAQGGPSGWTVERHVGYDVSDIACAGSVFVVTRDGQLLERTNAGLDMVATGADGLSFVSAAVGADGRLWIAGNQATEEGEDAVNEQVITSWTRADGLVEMWRASGPKLAAVAARGDDVWAFGEGELAVHGDGEAWTRPPLGGPVDILDAWMSEAGEVFAVGRDAAYVVEEIPGVLLHIDENGTITRQTTDLTNDVVAVAGGPTGPVIAFGQGGAIFEWDGGSRTWTRIQLVGVDAYVGHGAMFASDDRLWVVGAGGRVLWKAL